MTHLDDPTYLIHDSTRALLWCSTAAEIAAVAHRLVVDLGGQVADPDAAGTAAIPIDIAFGLGGAMVPVAPPTSLARLLLERHLPPFVEDCHRARSLLDDLSRARAAPMPTHTESLVAFSEIAVDERGASELADAFRRRLGAVDAHEGFQRLEVWADERDQTRFVMVSWWSTRTDFLRYMRSADHHCSHARIPTTGAPRPERFSRYTRIAT